MDVYMSRQPGHYGHHIWSLPMVHLGPSKQTFQRSFNIPASLFSNVCVDRLLGCCHVQVG
jgi:hypothetical protein